MAKRKQHHEEHADERWLVTYADMLTLMFVVFMVLFSMSVVNTGKFNELKQSLSKAFSNGLMTGGTSVMEQGSNTKTPPVVQETPGTISPQITGPLGVNMQSGSSTEASLETKQMEAVKSKVDAAVKAANKSDQVTTTVNQRGLVIQLQTDPFLFDSGSAQLHPEAYSLLTPIAASLKGLPNAVIVEGHTDTDRINSSQYASNWELGAARACVVTRALVGNGVPPTRMECGSFGEYQPQGDNSTYAGKQKNRRVDITVTRMNADTGTSGG